MSQVYHNAKVFNLDADSFKLTAPNYVMDSSKFYRATVGVTGARVIPAAATLTLDRVGSFVRLALEPIDPFGVPTAAAATGLFNLLGVVPLEYRPAINIVASVNTTANNIIVPGCFAIINTSGDIIIAAGPAFTTNYTIAQLCGLTSTLLVTYPKL